MSQNANILNESLKRFGVADYAVFAFMLTVCSLVGLYFGYKDHVKHKSNKVKSVVGTETLDYLLGGKNVQMFPVAMSLVASYVSGITLLGYSTEIYIYGSQYVTILAAPIVMGIFMHYVIIPVFYDLKVVSMFEYLQRRFDMRMRLFGSIFFSLSSVLWLPIVIYVPALAFNQTTGINIHVITPVVMTVCIFYTCLGGIKAVIWTDVIQIVVMYGVMLLIIIKGTLAVGGFWTVVDRNFAGGRIEAPDFHLDPMIRHSFWTIFIGGSSFWIVINTNQTAIQRFLSLKNQKEANQGLKIYVIGLTILFMMCIYNGFLLYATFHDCDPLTTKVAEAKDQLVPLLVMQVLKDLPGLPGLFIAGVFSAALSSLSSGLNSMAAIVLEDYFKPCYKNGLSERACGIIMRGSVVVVGASSVALVYVVENLGTVLQLSMTVPSTFLSSLFGVFLIGMFMPSIGNRAAFYGALTASIIMVYGALKAQLDISAGLINYETKMTSVAGCNYNFTLVEEELLKTPFQDLEKEFHHLSYLYFLPMGVLLTLIFAFILSFWFGFEDPGSVDPLLLAPFMRKYFISKTVESVADSHMGNNAIGLKFENRAFS